MSAPMVLRILAGAKTQTRRLLNPQPVRRRDLDAYIPCAKPDDWIWEAGKNDDLVTADPATSPTLLKRCRFGVPGDRLWVKESWRAEEREPDMVDGIRFQADDAFQEIANTKEAADAWIEANDNGRHGESWRPSIYMPRWASRLTLEITEVRVQQLQSITAEDAIAEGLCAITKDGKTIKYGIADRDGFPGTDDHGMPWHEWSQDTREAFRVLWDRLNGDRAAWDTNPWIFAISFRQVGQ